MEVSGIKWGNVRQLAKPGRDGRAHRRKGATPKESFGNSLLPLMGRKAMITKNVVFLHKSIPFLFSFYLSPVSAWFFLPAFIVNRHSGLAILYTGLAS